MDPVFRINLHQVEVDPVFKSTCCNQVEVDPVFRINLLLPGRGGPCCYQVEVDPVFRINLLLPGRGGPCLQNQPAATR